MEYTRKPVRSRPGLSQEQALASLYESPYFSNPGTRVASIKPRGDRWIAELEIPKTAADDEGDSESAPAKSSPPFAEGGPDSEGSDDSDSSSDSGDPASSGPPGAPGEGEKKPEGKGGTEQQILHVLTEILHSLQGGPPGGGMGGPDDLGPGAGGPPAPPPHGGPMGGPAGPPGGKMPMGGGAKLRPGEVPNRPGMMPVGAPAFSHTHTAMGIPGTPGMPGAMPGPGGQGGKCPQCGGPVGPDGSCPTCNMGGHGGMPGGPSALGPPGTAHPLTASLEAKIAQVAGKAATITVSARQNMSIKQAKAELEAIAGQYGYKVRQIKRDETTGAPRALLSVR